MITPKTKTNVYLSFTADDVKAIIAEYVKSQNMSGAKFKGTIDINFNICTHPDDRGDMPGFPRQIMNGCVVNITI